MKKNILALFIFVTATTYGQVVKIDGKSYKTISKETLNSEVEFVKLKLKVIDRSNDEYFIKVKSEYFRTSFTAAAVKSFFTTGKLSSLGTVKKTKMAGKPVIYIDKGSAIVIVNYNKEAIGFIEIQDEKTILTVRNSLAKAANDDNPGGSTGDPLLDCGVDCLNIFIACGNSELCRSAYRKCWSDCKNKHQSQGGSVSYYSIPLNKLAVKI